TTGGRSRGIADGRPCPGCSAGTANGSGNSSHSGSPHPVPWLQRGQGSHARRAASAVGSIGNTIHRPIRQHTGADQLVVDSLLLLVEVGVQHVVGLLFFGQYCDRVPVVADRLEDGGAPPGFIEREV